LDNTAPAARRDLVGGPRTGVLFGVLLVSALTMTSSAPTSVGVDSRMTTFTTDGVSFSPVVRKAQVCICRVKHTSGTVHIGSSIEPHSKKTANKETTFVIELLSS